jgi:hypothetical protein
MMDVNANQKKIFLVNHQIRHVSVKQETLLRVNASLKIKNANVKQKSLEHRKQTNQSNRDVNVNNRVLIF